MGTWLDVGRFCAVSPKVRGPAPAMASKLEPGSRIGSVVLLEAQDHRGDDLTLSQTEKGIELAPFEQEFEMKLKAFEKSRRSYRNALRELAK